MWTRRSLIALALAAIMTPLALWLAPGPAWAESASPSAIASADTGSSASPSGSSEPSLQPSSETSPSSDGGPSADPSPSPTASASAQAGTLTADHIDGLLTGVLLIGLFVAVLAGAKLAGA